MLRKRNRSVQKDQQHMHSDSHIQSDILVQKLRTNSFFNIPGVFVGFNPKGPSDSDAIKSPTSPLDFRVLSNLGRSPPRIPNDVQQRSWDCSKVGLSIIDSLDDNRTGKVLRSSDSKTVLFGVHMRIKTPNYKSHMNSFETRNSLPKSYAIFKSSHSQKGNSDVLFEIGETLLEAKTFGKNRSCSLDSVTSLSYLTGSADHSPNLIAGSFSFKNVGSPLSSAGHLIEETININSNSDTKPTSISLSTGSGHGLIGPLSASEIELSEDYTRVTSHGPNSKTTHIFGDCILECHTKDLLNFTNNEELKVEVPGVAKCSGMSTSFPSNGFLSFCYFCKKKLEGEDIYMYRGEKAFCSLSCRSEEILIDEETGETNQKSSEISPGTDSCEETLSSMFIVV